MTQTKKFDDGGIEKLEDTIIRLGGDDEETLLFAEMPGVTHEASAVDHAREAFCHPTDEAGKKEQACRKLCEIFEITPGFPAESYDEGSFEDALSELLINPKGEVVVSLDPGTDPEGFLKMASHRLSQLTGNEPVSPNFSFLVIDERPIVEVKSSRAA